MTKPAQDSAGNVETIAKVIPIQPEAPQAAPAEAAPAEAVLSVIPKPAPAKAAQSEPAPAKGGPAVINGIPAAISPKAGTIGAKALDTLVNPGPTTGGLVLASGIAARILGAPFIGANLMLSGAWIVGESAWKKYQAYKAVKKAASASAPTTNPASTPITNPASTPITKDGK